MRCLLALEVSAAAVLGENGEIGEIGERER